MLGADQRAALLACLAVACLTGCHPTTVKSFTHAHLWLDQTSVMGTTAGSDAELPLDHDADVYIPGSAVGASVVRLQLTGECDGAGSVTLTLSDHDPWWYLFWAADDELDRRTAICTQRADKRFAFDTGVAIEPKVENNLRFWCAGTLSAEVRGPLGGSGESDPQLYAKDASSPKQIPAPAGQKYWYFHCAGSELEVVPR